MEHSDLPRGPHERTTAISVRQRPGGRVVCGIASSPEDLGKKLERLLQEQPGEDAPDDLEITTDEPEAAEELAAEDLPPAEPAVEEPPSEVHQQMDLLRDQLEMAFDEVVTRISRVEHRLSSSILMELEERSAETLTLLHRLVATVDHAVELAEEPIDWPPTGGNDVSAQIEENRLRVEARLESLHTQISHLRDVPPTVDVSALEDAADRGALRNAADIATVRQGVDNLSDLVRLQEKSISELRSTLEWIKERLLLR